MACSPTPTSTEYEATSYISKVTQVTTSAEVYTPTETVTFSTQVCKGGESSGRGAKGNFAWRSRTDNSLSSRAVPTAPPSLAKMHILAGRDEGRWANGWKEVTEWAGSALSDWNERHGSPTRGPANAAAMESTTPSARSTSTSTSRAAEGECTWSTYTTTSLAEPTTSWKTHTVESAKMVTTLVAVKTLYAECPATRTATRLPLKAAETAPAQRTTTAGQSPATKEATSTNASDQVIAMSAQASSTSSATETVALDTATTELAPTTLSPATTLVASASPDQPVASSSASASDLPTDSAQLPAVAGTTQISNAVPSQVSPVQSNSENTSSRQVNTGAIVGGVLGAIVIFGLLVCFVRAYSKHKRTKRAEALRSTWFSGAYEDHDDNQDGQREKAASQMYSRFSAPSVAHMDTGSRSRLSNGLFARMAPAYVTDPLTRMSSGRFPTLGTVTQKIRQSLHLGEIDHGWVRKVSDTSSGSDHSGRAFPAGSHGGMQSALSQQQSIEELETPSSNGTFGGQRQGAATAYRHRGGGMQQPRTYDSDGQPRSVHWGHSYSPPGSRDLDAEAAGHQRSAGRHASESYTVDEQDGEVISFSPNHPFSAAASDMRGSTMSSRSGGTTPPRTLIPARPPQITYEPADTGSSLFEYEHVFTGLNASQPGAMPVPAAQAERRISAATTVTIARSVVSDTQRETRHWYDKPYWDRQETGLSAGTALSPLPTTMPRQPAGQANTSPRSEEFSPYGQAL